MKNLDKKAFVLAESIVVGVFIMTLFTFIFSNIVPLLAKYEEKEKYDDVSAVYDANTLRNAILLDFQRNPSNNTTTKIFGSLSTQSYVYYDGDSICNNLAMNAYCQVLLSKKYLNVEAVIASKYKTAALKSKKDDFSRVVGDYINDLPEYTSSVGSIYDSYYRLIIIFNDGSIANVELQNIL